jgi:hypothetical protein
MDVVEFIQHSFANHSFVRCLECAQNFATQTEWQVHSEKEMHFVFEDDVERLAEVMGINTGEFTKKRRYVILKDNFERQAGTVSQQLCSYIDLRFSESRKCSMELTIAILDILQRIPQTLLPVSLKELEQMLCSSFEVPTIDYLLREGSSLLEFVMEKDTTFEIVEETNADMDMIYKVQLCSAPNLSVLNTSLEQMEDVDDVDPSPQIDSCPPMVSPSNSPGKHPVVPGPNSVVVPIERHRVMLNEILLHRISSLESASSSPSVSPSKPASKHSANEREIEDISEDDVNRVEPIIKKLEFALSILSDPEPSNVSFDTHGASASVIKKKEVQKTDDCNTLHQFAARLTSPPLSNDSPTIQPSRSWTPALSRAPTTECNRPKRRFDDITKKPRTTERNRSTSKRSRTGEVSE